MSVVSPMYEGPLYEDTSDATQTTGVESGMGQDAFLKMFMAQLTNQNPLDPMDNTEFTAQLATFSQLEQLTGINDKLEVMSELKTSVEHGTVLGYLGKEVTLGGDLLPVSEGYTGSARFTLEARAEVRAVITDEDGDMVAEVHLGQLSPGNHEFDWDGTTTAGQPVPDGVYQVTLGANDLQGDPVEITNQMVTGLVTGWQKGTDGENYLMMGVAALPVSSVLQVTQPTAESAEAAEAEQHSGDDTEVGDGTNGEDDGTLDAILDTLVNLGGLAALLL